VKRRIELRGVDGSRWDLCEGPVLANLSPHLWGSGPVAITEKVAATLPGSRITNRRHQAIDLVIPLEVFDPTFIVPAPVSFSKLADDDGVLLVDDHGVVLVDGDAIPPFVPTSIEDIIAAFARAIDSVQGDVTVSVTRSDGTVRVITATYLAGWSQLSMIDARATSVEGTVALRAADPFWAAVADESVIIAPPAPVFTEGSTLFDDAAVGFDDPLPFDGFLVDDVLFDDPTVLFDGVVGFSGLGAGVRLVEMSNVGDVDAWPTFTMVGPAEVIELDNVTSGARWRIDGLAAGQKLSIVTRPGETVVQIDGRNAYGRLAPGSQLWPIRKGSNTVAVRFDGTDPAISKFSVSWRPRYLTC
jgi:hypothetical protein